MKISVINKEGKESEKLDLPSGLFGGKVNTGVMHQAIVMYRASLRQGNASTKERSDVRGGGKKPYRQKGTGRARAGSSRSPLWRSGGVTFGPHKRDFSYALPQKVRKVALRESINSKLEKNNLVCISDLKEVHSKTKEFSSMLKKLNLKGKILGVLDGCDASVAKVSKNIPLFSLISAKDVNAYDILRHRSILLSKSALASLVERVSNSKLPGKISKEEK